MDHKSASIHIIGAGISGLTAAKTLQAKGYKPTIIEATERAGGRVKTDIVNGYQLDHGFQVLLTAYPAAQKHLDYTQLSLQQLLPGAIVFVNGKKQVIGDPKRHLSLLWPTLMAQIGSVGDKFKILKLDNALKQKTIESIFEEEEQTTQAFLQGFGFSDRIINRFFKPFFSGIFLEPHLATSSRMFQFVYKMFGQGYAALPKAGIEAIPHQMAQELTACDWQYNTRVASVQPGKVVLNEGNEASSDYTIIATEASGLVPNLAGQQTEWKSCDTLYFECSKRAFEQPFIGLIAEEEALVNNIFYHTSVASSQKGSNELLSVTIVKPHQLDEAALVAQVRNELTKYCGIEVGEMLKRYTIRKALPNLNSLQYSLAASATKLTDGVYLAGDTLLNGSLNAAMEAGEQAAIGVIEAIEGSNGLFKR